MHAKEELPPVSEEALIKAMAVVKMEWMAPGVVTQDPPFDWKEFQQLGRLR